jgi:hypothetical protein
MIAPLAELQAAFRAAILGGDAAALTSFVHDDGIAAERRIAIYRNNTMASLTEALAATYPVVRRLVDERFFAYLANTFVVAEPPRHGRLADYGAGLPRFLDTFEPVQRLPYLPDVARLEWAMNEAMFEADATPLDPSALTGLDPAGIDGLRLIAHPSVRLVASRWPIDLIWEANQTGADGAVDLGRGAARIVVQRPRLAVVYRSLGPGSFVLLRALVTGHPLGEAAGIAAQAEPSFDLQSALLDHLVAGSFSGFLAAQT